MSDHNPPLNDDPFAQREAEKYDNPVPSREFLLEYLQNFAGPATHEQLCEALELHDEERIEALRRRLRAMERDGQLIFTRKGGYGLVNKMDLIAGRVMGHRDGFGFVVPDDGSDDLYLHERQMRAVFDGDRVLVRVRGEDFKGRREAAIVEVVERAVSRLVGRYFEEYGNAFVTPDNTKIAQDVLIRADGSVRARQGQVVLVEIDEYPSKRGHAVGRIVQILGDHLAPGMETQVAIYNYGIPNEWSDEALAELDAIAEEVAESDKQGRVDLRHLPLVTIDGEDARDFDDAVYAERKKGGGWRLYVAIADVSHYIRPGTALDQEALKRGNSTYFPGQVVPMLPEKISNGLCSLNPQVDRLAMVCEATISAAGNISGYKFYEAVFQSQARLTYTKVSQMLERPDSSDGQELRQRYTALVPHLEALFELYHALRVARDVRGAIDFETTETRIVFGEGRKIDQVVPVQRNEAHRLIEECMLCANVCAARFLQKNKLPALYRIHEGPKAERLDKLRAYLAPLGLNLSGGDKPQPSDYQALLSSIQQRPDYHPIQTMLLRSMSQAVYSPDNEGHFGLGYKAYTHFTSPIRRYPDLLVHRAIRALLRREQNEGALYGYHYDLQAMVALGEQCSSTERRSDEASRDVVSWLKCEYMSHRVGEEYQGVISAVTNFGCFIELSEVYVEGLVHVSGLPGDYYHYDAAFQRLKGERTGKSFRLGDQVRVKVSRVDLDERKIDFELIEGPARRVSKSVRDRLRDGDIPPALARTASQEKVGTTGAKSGGKGTGSRKPKDSSTASAGKEKKARKAKVKASIKAKRKAKETSRANKKHAQPH
ncbi:ribonuclease R [Pokkaliibacter sp. MBI-7]|uniref:ribonuclease R n=1 Tax=Pokkaliibacter sp. MBI-7 TaxID=3040600 RepID=UPI002447B9E1|nr:ribonuclease R [Pokkaliibacter sp. MBI-7]MDH2432215.1 ribonuclease R [Pokkaliibacter sp. MBI-7]